MNVFQRIFPRLQKKENPAYRAIMSIYGAGTPIWTPRDYGNLTRAGYQYCSTVFACVSKIAKGGSRIAWTLGKKQRGGGMGEIEEHPLLKLLAKPNEFEGGSRFSEKVLSYLLLAGNSYVLKVHGVQSMPPPFLYSLRPDRMTAVAGNWKAPIARYEYSTGIAPEKFEARDILHLREFHPTNDFYGLSRLEVAARAIDISNKSMEWNKKLLDNDMRPPGIVKLNPALMEEQFREFVTKFNEQYAGYSNAGSVPIFNAGVEWQSTSMSPKDLDWTTGQKEIMRQICTIFDVCSQLLGDTENTTYSNMQEARKALYMEAILPLMDLYRDELNAWLVPLYDDGLYLDYDRDAIEALQEERAQKYAYLNASYFLSINEKRIAVGEDEVEGGDVILVPIGMIPLEQATAEPEPVPDALQSGTEGKPADEEEPVDEEKSGAGADEKAATGLKPASKPIPEHKATGFWSKPERKERLWQTFETRVKARERSFEQIAKGYLRAQADALRQKAARLGSVSGAHATDIFSVKEEAKRYAKTFTAWYIDHFIRAGNAGMHASKGELFDDAEFKSLAWKGDPKKPTSWVFEMTPEQAEKLKDMIFNSGTKVNETMLDTVEKMIKTANENNWTVGEFAQNLSDKIGDLGPWKAQLWARTESVRVDSFGALEGMKQTEFVERKVWICSFVPDSREEHRAADDQEVDLDDDFMVGGEALAYPCDARGSAANTCNCLCAIAPVVGEAEG